MARYVSLINWTEKGMASFRDTVDRGEAAAQLAGSFGVSFVDINWTMGPYDIVAVLEAPDDESASAFALALGASGNLRMTTMRAFSDSEMRGIIAKTG
jgi:uncharacterized protein with GYD domain